MQIYKLKKNHINVLHDFVYDLKEKKKTTNFCKFRVARIYSVELCCSRKENSNV